MTTASYVLNLAVDGAPAYEVTTTSLELVGFQLRTVTRRIAAREDDDAPVWDWIEAGHQHALDQLAEGHSVTVEFDLQAVARHVTWQLHLVIPGAVDKPVQHISESERPALPAGPESLALVLEEAR